VFSLWIDAFLFLVVAFLLQLVATERVYPAMGSGSQVSAREWAWTVLFVALAAEVIWLIILALFLIAIALSNSLGWPLTAIVLGFAILWVLFGRRIMLWIRFRK